MNSDAKPVLNVWSRTQSGTVSWCLPWTSPFWGAREGLSSAAPPHPNSGQVRDGRVTWFFPSPCAPVLALLVGWPFLALSAAGDPPAKRQNFRLAPNIAQLLGPTPPTKPLGSRSRPWHLEPRYCAACGPLTGFTERTSDVPPGSFFCPRCAVAPSFGGRRGPHVCCVPALGLQWGRGGRGGVTEVCPEMEKIQLYLTSSSVLLGPPWATSPFHVSVCLLPIF